ncbi:MAG: TIGR02530 family flagellar biosynthesis protein [Solirubrobacterales bacterium]
MSALSNPALLPTGAPPAAAPAGPSAGGRVAIKPRPAGPEGPSFAEVLHKTAAPEPLRFSRHALERVQRRGIELDHATLNRLHDGVGRAAGKGSRDSVVLVDGTAFVVSVASRTVVTAVGAEHMREHVFTNIDSAVIA